MGAYGNSPTLYQMVLSPTPYGLPFTKIGGSQPPPRTLIAIISGASRVTNFKFGRYIHRVHRNKRPLKILKKEGGRIRGLPIFGYLDLRNGESYGLQIWQIHSRGPAEQKPVKNFREKGAWVYSGAAQFLAVTPYFLRKG